MRASVLQKRHLLQQCRRTQSSPLRNFTTTPSAISTPSTSSIPSSPICTACHRPLSRPKSPKTAPPSPSQRRLQSSSSSSSSSPGSSQRHNRTTSPPPPPQTHYEIFPKTLPQGPPPTGPFHIDVRELRKEFLQLQAVAHPDRHPTALKTRAESTSALINEAYKTLQNPLLRTQYLLRLRGIDIAEDETAKVEDPELLMEVLDTREEIEEAQEEGELEGLKRVNDGRIEESERAIEEGFGRDDIDGVKGEAVRLRYWVNIKESLDGWEKGKPVVVVH